MLSITISTSNDAFQENPGEIGRILNDLVTHIEYPGLTHGDKILLRDYNGNVVGRAEYWESEDEE